MVLQRVAKTSQKLVCVVVAVVCEVLTCTLLVGLELAAKIVDGVQLMTAELFRIPLINTIFCLD
jgi:hypothetical protein